MIITDNIIEKDILEAKIIINRWLLGKTNKYNSNNPSFSNTYLFTNENINYYYSQIDFSIISNALTVLSSGDHLFNLLLKGIKDIDTFDINRLTYYYALGFKKAMILKYSHSEFLNIYKKLIKRDIYMYDVIIDLLPVMDENQRMFWQAIIDYAYNIQKNYKTMHPIEYEYIIDLLKLFTYSIDKNDYIKGNIYLNNSENYEQLKMQLNNANITFREANAIQLEKYFDKKYDLIILSNILDYFYHEYGISWNYDMLIKYENRLRKITNPNALIILHYIFCFCGGRSDYIEPLIDNSKISIGDLRHEKTLIVPPIKKRIYSLNDGIIYKRAK